MNDKLKKLFERFLGWIAEGTMPALVGLLVALQVLPALAALQPDRLTNKPKARIGAGVAQDSDFGFDVGAGASNPVFNYKNSDGSVGVNKNKMRVGDGLSSDKTLEADIGAGANNPKQRFNSTTGKWEFSDNGTSFNQFGSGSGGGGGGVNLLESTDNPGFEDGVAQWTASGGSFTADTSTPLFGTTSGLWDASALNQTLSSNAKTVPNGLKGQSCLAMISYQFTGATGDYKLQAYDGTAVLAEQSLDPAVSPAVGNGYVGFTCPTTGTVLLRLIAGVSNPAAIRVDGPSIASGKVQLGSNLMLANISQATLMGGVVISGCSGGWSTTSTSYTTFPVTTGCTYTPFGQGLAPATQIPAVRFANLPPGEYFLQMEGNWLANGSFYSYMKFHDGTNFAREESRLFNGYGNGINQSISYSSSQTNVTLNIQAKADSGGTVAINGNQGQGITIKVWKFPSQAQAVITPPESSSQAWSGYTSCTGSPTTTSTTYADVTAGTSCLVTQLQNEGFGSVVKGATDTSIDFVPASIGKYFVCGTAQSITNGGPFSLALTDASNNILAAQGQLSATGASATLCGLYNATTIGTTLTAKIRLATVSGTASMNSSVSGAAGSHTVVWNIFKVSQQFPMPYLAKQLQSPSSFVMNHASARLNCVSGTCSIVAAQNDGGWITGIIRNSVGNFTMSVNAGTFSQEPNCVCTVNDNSQEKNCQLYNVSATSISVQTDLGGASSDRDFYLMCTGKK